MSDSVALIPRPKTQRSGHAGSKLINGGGEATRYREPHRLRFRGKVEEHREPVSLFVCEPLDVSEDSVAVRAVGALERGMCRWPFGRMEHLTFCGAKATVKIGGALTYCAECARRAGFDLQAWQRAQDAARKHLGGMP